MKFLPSQGNMQRIIILTLCVLLASCRIGPAALISNPTLAPIPPELSIEEHALTQPPEASTLSYTSPKARRKSILAKHAEERLQIISFVDRSCNVGNQLGQCATLGTDRLAAWEDYDTSAPFGSGKVTLTRNGSRIYQIPVGDSSPIGSLRGLWTYAAHWALETAFVTNHQHGNEIDSQATGQISIDGKLLNSSWVTRKLSASRPCTTRHSISSSSTRKLVLYTTM